MLFGIPFAHRPGEHHIEAQQVARHVPGMRVDGEHLGPRAKLGGRPDQNGHRDPADRHRVGGAVHEGEPGNEAHVVTIERHMARHRWAATGSLGRAGAHLHGLSARQPRTRMQSSSPWCDHDALVRTKLERGRLQRAEVVTTIVIHLQREHDVAPDIGEANDPLEVRGLTRYSDRLVGLGERLLARRCRAGRS